jgi:hypothetical protein
MGCSRRSWATPAIEPVAAAPFISFLSDYGLQDEFVGVCHAVIARICPEARVLDISHGIPRHDVLAGALALRDAYDHLPDGVILAVVDPDVGAQRRAVALELADGRLAVGPDNGLLYLAAQRAGGIRRAVDIAISPFRLEPVSATFHGRDIFAPVAARLAAGSSPVEAGAPVDPAELIGLELPRPRVAGGALETHVLYVDRFGNVTLDAGHEELDAAGLRLGRAITVSSTDGREHLGHFARTFADVDPGELLLYEDARHRLAVAISGGDAARRLGVGTGDRLEVTTDEH